MWVGVVEFVSGKRIGGDSATDQASIDGGVEKARAQ